MARDRLEEYRSKRAFDRTPEPAPSPDAGAPPAPGAPQFVVHKHDARRLHYDVRLEADGVLVSWAVPKGPSYDPKVKRLAVHVEDHPLDYATFEGVIPEAQYGSGTVLVWDRGTYRNLTERRGRPIELADAVGGGHVSVWLDGSKLHGGWSLTRTDGKNWLLVKRADEHADAGLDITAAAPASAASGRSLAEVADAPEPARWSRAVATWTPPMLAQKLERAGLGAVAGEGWRYERKLDGLRCLAVRNGMEVTLWSRNHQPFTARFPAVVEALARLPADNFTVDGEVVVFSGGRTSFSGLQRPGHSTQPVLCAFDLLHLLGRDTTGLPLSDRQALLARTLEGAEPAVRPVEPLRGDPETLLDRACTEGWEGLVAKRVSSPYRSGRSPDWRKVKCSASQELVVVGWTDPGGSRVGFGALLVGYYDEGGVLRYAGKVGTGFDQRTLRDLHAQLRLSEVRDAPVAERVPAKGVHWVRPELVAAIEFSEWTADGRLRHPSFQGLRDDKDPREILRETTEQDR